MAASMAVRKWKRESSGEIIFSLKKVHPTDPPLAALCLQQHGDKGGLNYYNSIDIKCKKKTHL